MTHYVYCLYVFCFFKQKTAYEMRISDWSSDVCSSDLHRGQCWPLSVHYLGVEVEDALVLAEGSITTPDPSITCNPGRPAECRRLRAEIHDIIDRSETRRVGKVCARRFDRCGSGIFIKKMSIYHNILLTIIKTHI